MQVNQGGAFLPFSEGVITREPPKKTLEPPKKTS